MASTAAAVIAVAAEEDFSLDFVVGCAVRTRVVAAVSDLFFDSGRGSFLVASAPATEPPVDFSFDDTRAAASDFEPAAATPDVDSSGW